MRRVFADTAYWVALLNRRDRWHARAADLSRTLGRVRLVTTEEVLAEVPTYFSAFDAQVRGTAADPVLATLHDPDTLVLEQGHDSFLSGVSLYRRRLDKSYSLTDCVSMEQMRRLKLREILTTDDHFSQEGFVILMV